MTGKPAENRFESRRDGAIAQPALGRPCEGNTLDAAAMIATALSSQGDA